MCGFIGEQVCIWKCSFEKFIEEIYNIRPLKTHPFPCKQQRPVRTLINILDPLHTSDMQIVIDVLLDNENKIIQLHLFQCFFFKQNVCYILNVYILYLYVQ